MVSLALRSVEALELAVDIVCMAIMALYLSLRLVFLTFHLVEALELEVSIAYSV